MDIVTNVYGTRTDINRSLSNKGLTLYSYCKEIENIDSRLQIFKSSKMIDVEKMQKDMFYLYESNPILYDSLQGRQSIEDSLKELAHFHKGITKILPWRKNKVHNERIKQMGELISKPYGLKTNGILVPDNFFTGGIEITAALFGLGYVAAKYLISKDNMTPEELNAQMHFCQVQLPAVTSILFGTLIGIGMNLDRFRKLPFEEAKYLDGKVKELYT